MVLALYTSSNVDDTYMKFCENSLTVFNLQSGHDFVTVQGKLLKKYKRKCYGSCALHVSHVD